MIAALSIPDCFSLLLLFFRKKKSGQKKNVQKAPKPFAFFYGIRYNDLQTTLIRPTAAKEGKTPWQIEWLL